MATKDVTRRFYALGDLSYGTFKRTRVSPDPIYPAPEPKSSRHATAIDHIVSFPDFLSLVSLLLAIDEP